MVLTQGDIEFDHIGIGTALLRHRFVVPLNQREYSWEQEHVLDLFHDLAKAINEAKSSYFLGTIVLTPGHGGVTEVADGQQRLATTTILLGAIRDYFHSRNEELLVTSLEQFLFDIARERALLSICSTSVLHEADQRLSDKAICGLDANTCE